MNQENLHRLLMEAPAAIAILRGKELRYELSNPRNQELAGHRQLVGLTVREALPELEAEGLIAVAGQVMQTGQPFFAHELPVRFPATASRPERLAYLSGTYQPLRGADGAIDGIMSFAFEVTDQVHARRRAEEAEARLRLAVEAAGMGTWDFYPQTNAIECDGRYRALFGLPAQGPVAAQDFIKAIVPEDLDRVHNAVAQAFDPKGSGEYRIEYRVRGVADGIERSIEMRGRAFFDERGTPTRFTGTGLDMSANRRSGDRLRFLAEAGATLGSSLDYRATLSQIARLAVPRLADWCIVEMLRDDQTLEQVAVAHVDPSKVPLGLELRTRYQPGPEQGGGVRQVLATGKPVFVPEVSEESRQLAARDADHLRLLQVLAVRSYIIVPLQLGGRTVGVVILALSESGRAYEADDLALAQELASRANMAMENARLFQAAEQAVEKRDDFLSIASHELKTPLASLGLYLDGARGELHRTNRPPDLDKLRARMDRASAQLDRVILLLNHLLDVSRISAGRLQLQVTETDLAVLAGEVIGRLQEQAARAGCQVRLQVSGPATGRWDQDRLDEVLTNLLINALKFGAGSPVEVEVTSRPEGVRLRVRDQGPGVLPEDRQRVFERFERTIQARNIGGIGLGLWISRQIVLAHGGTIAIESETLQGASFIVDLPTDVPEPAPDPGGR